jgi:hypothetical protein
MKGVYVAGIGVLGPGLEGWAASRPVLAGIDAYAPATLSRPTGAGLPATERRRSTVVTRLAVDVASAALGGTGLGNVAAVFASSGGEVDVIHGIFDQLAGTDRRLSPTAFHNSVHNAASGYWSIATGCQGAIDSLCAYDDSFGSGLAEALLRCGHDGRDVLLVAYDLPPPLPILEFRHLFAPFGVALLFKASAGPGTIAELRGGFLPEDLPATRVDDPGLESLRLGNPAARCLPLLAALAREVASEVQLGCGMGGALRLEVRPWL